MKILLIVLTGLLLTGTFSCRQRSISKGIDTVYTVEDPTGVKVHGIGAELDPHFFSYCVGHAEHPASEKDWDIVVDRVKHLRLQMFRVMVQPQWFEPFNDDNDPDHINWNGLDFDTPEMKSLYRVLDLAQQNGINVLLVSWGCPRKSFLADGHSTFPSWIVGPKNEAEYAENLSILIQHLVIKKGYTCIKEITPYNEPNLFYFMDGKVSVDSYISMCKKLDAKFKSDNIRSLVDFNLVDESGGYDFLKKCADELHDEADLMNSHMYTFGYGTPNQDILNYEEKNRNTVPGRLPHFIGEFGSNQVKGAYLQSDIDEYLRGVLIVRLMLNVFNAGASGMSYWSLFDEYYYKNAPYDEGLMKTGLWRYKKSSYAGSEFYHHIQEDFQLRPQYFAYGLMTNHVKPGAAIYPVKTGKENVAASAFRNQDGKWVYVIANEQSDKLKISLFNNFQKKGVFDVFQYIEKDLSGGNEMIGASGSVVQNGRALPIEVPARSVVLLHQQ